jgi:trk system potassium uptake protein TrkH
MSAKKGLRCFLLTMAPVKLVVLGYLSYMLAGWLLLCLPISHWHIHIGCLDNLFISVSAVSTTGLVTVATDQYSLFGQIVIAALIQLGGVGYMTLGSFVILSRGRDLSDLRADVSGAVFSLPDGFRIDKFVRSVVIFTFIVELSGTIALYFIFKSCGVERPIWCSIFHSISAFCTAGFGLFSNSFEQYAGNFWLNFVIAMLSIIGAMGFIVLVDVWHRLTGKIEEITFTSKIIIRMSIILIVIGTILLLITEPAVKTMPPEKGLIVSVFQSMTAMTTVGFDTIPINSLRDSSLLILIFLMIIGASPSGTGGGIKSTSFTAVVALVRSALRKDREVRFLGKRIPSYRLRAAMANVAFYLFVLIWGVFALTLTESKPFKDLFFETASALGTVGLSTGITSSLSSLGKIITCVLMYIGRLGPLAFAIALIEKPVKKEGPRHDMAV